MQDHIAPDALPALTMESVTPRLSTRLRRRIYEVMEAGHGVVWESFVFDSFIVALILLNVAAFVAETVPSIAAAHGRELAVFELVSVIIFTIEYALRLWISIEVPYLSRMSPLKARLSFARRPAQIIDVLAILPYYLAQFFSLDLRVLRVLRLLRFLKLSRYSPAMYTLIRVIETERRALMGAGLLLIMAVLFAATGIYFLESAAQPDKFGSVPDSAWWAIATLTTVGYGDVVPITPLGRLFGSITMVCGLCILALPVAIISTGFAQELSRRDFVITWSLMSRIPILAELDAREAGQVMPLLHAHNFPPNFEVVAAGITGHAMYFVASGSVTGRKTGECGGEPIRFETGDIFGAWTMLRDDVTECAFVTSSQCRLLKLHKEDFYRLEAGRSVVVECIRRAAAGEKRIAVAVERDNETSI